MVILGATAIAVVTAGPVVAADVALSFTVAATPLSGIVPVSASAATAAGTAAVIAQGAVAGAAATGAKTGAVAIAGTAAAITKGAVAYVYDVGAVAAALGAKTAGASSACNLSSILLACDPKVALTLLGAEPHSSAQHHPSVGDATFDCWKPVVRDGSTEPSRGKLLKEIFVDQRVKEIIVHESRNKFDLPELRLVNIWGEQFDISYLVLPTNNQLVAHAVRVA